VLSRKWSYPIIKALSEPMGFSDLQRELRFITNHILTRELKLLQQERIVEQRGRYQLTPAGKALYEALEPLEQWSVKHAGTQHCPPNRKCSTCLSYPQAIGARAFVSIGKK
jgi:DNA-binding HxlR family transcriptional regulator